MLAYTYGAYPKKGAARQNLLQVLKQKDIQLAFRIGNRLNHLPVKDPFVVQRIDIRGNESFQQFRKKLLRGGRRFFLFCRQAACSWQLAACSLSCAR